MPTAPPFPRGKPDSDKLARSTLHLLGGIVFDDDSRVARLELRKVYATPEQEGAWIGLLAPGSTQRRVEFDPLRVVDRFTVVEQKNGSAASEAFKGLAPPQDYLRQPQADRLSQVRRGDAGPRKL